MSSPSRPVLAGPTTGRWWDLLVPVFLIALAVLSVGVHVPKNQALSPLDEYVYADYVYKLPEQLVVTQGEDTGSEAREALACLGTRGIPGGPETTCETAGEAPDSAFVMGGATSADIYTPLYFVVSWTVAQPLELVGVDVFDAVSLVGALWLSIGVAFLYAALRRLGLTRGLAFAAGLLFISTPPVFWASTYVSTDAPTLAVGGALLWLVVRALQTDRGHVAIVAVSVVGVLFKVQNIAVVGFAALALVLAVVLGRRRARPEEDDQEEQAGPAATIRVSPVKALVTAVASVVLAVAGQAVWLMVRGQIATAPSPDQGTAEPLMTKDLIAESLKFLAGTAGDPTGRINGIPLTAIGTLVGWLSVLGVLGCVVLVRRGHVVHPVAWAALVVSLVVGPLLVLGVSVVSGYYFELPTRYGLSLLPAFLACAFVLMGRREHIGRVVVPGALLLYVAALVTS